MIYIDNKRTIAIDVIAIIFILIYKYLIILLSYYLIILLSYYLIILLYLVSSQTLLICLVIYFLFFQLGNRRFYNSS